MELTAVGVGNDLERQTYGESDNSLIKDINLNI
jgi:hypothetical protein